MYPCLFRYTSELSGKEKAAIAALLVQAGADPDSLCTFECFDAVATHHEVLGLYVPEDLDSIKEFFALIEGQNATDQLTCMGFEG